MVPVWNLRRKAETGTALSTAWMQVEDLEENLPYYRVRASMEDTAKVTAVRGRNFKAWHLPKVDGRLKPLYSQPYFWLGHFNGEAGQL